MPSSTMSVLAPIAVHVLIILAAGGVVALLFTLSRRGIVGSPDEDA